MALFDDPNFEAEMIKRVRERLLGSVGAHDAHSVINNYGGPAASGDHGRAGLVERMAAGGEDPFDYLVDIERHDLPVNPETGKPAGWTKKVHRHRQKKDHEPGK